jgi:Sec-independent protein translocase protein TatA
MDFLGVGPLELIFVLAIIILVIGPKDIGKTAKTIGRFLNRVYKSDEWRALTEASRTIRTLPNRLAREAELEELEEIRQSIKGTTEDIERTRDELTKDTKAAIPSLSPKSVTQEDAMKAWTSPSSDPETEEK